MEVKGKKISVIGAARSGIGAAVCAASRRTSVAGGTTVVAGSSVGGGATCVGGARPGDGVGSSARCGVGLGPVGRSNFWSWAPPVT